MSDAVYVDQAANWTKRMTANEARGPGDMENAWRRLEARYAIPWRTFWALRYRKPAFLSAFTFEQIRTAYQAECERQRRLYEHELEITKAKTGAASAVARAAVALGGEADGEAQ